MSAETENRINLRQAVRLFGLVGDERRAALFDALASKATGVRFVDLKRDLDHMGVTPPIRIQTVINYADDLSQAGLAEKNDHGLQLTDFGRNVHSMLSVTATKLEAIGREQRISAARSILAALPPEDVQQVLKDFNG